MLTPRKISNILSYISKFVRTLFWLKPRLVDGTVQEIEQNDFRKLIKRQLFVYFFLNHVKKIIRVFFPTSCCKPSGGNKTVSLCSKYKPVFPYFPPFSNYSEEDIHLPSQKECSHNLWQLKIIFIAYFLIQTVFWKSLKQKFLPKKYMAQYLNTHLNRNII